MFKGDSTFLVVHNMPVTRLLDRLYSIYRYTGDGVDFVDETKYKDNIDISIPWRDDGAEPQFMDQLREAIHLDGLDLVEKSFEETVLVLRDTMR